MEVPSKFLPDPQEAVNKDVKLEVHDEVKPEGKTEVKEPEKREVAKEIEQPKGSKTPESNLYAALEEERRARKELERKLKEISEPKVQDDEVFSDEGKALKRNIGELEAEIRTLKESKELEVLYQTYPELKSAPDFDEFRSDYSGITLDKVARLYLSEKGLLGGQPERKGLEKPSGGSKTPPASITQDDLKRLRENEPRRYIKLIREGKINPDEVK